MMNLQLTTLGGFSLKIKGIVTPGPATRKSRALMVFLIMNRNVAWARERLLEIFWPDADPERARNSLKTALWSIRRCLRSAGEADEQFLQATNSTITWVADATVDAEQFANLALQDDRTGEAIEMFRGDFLEGDYDNWAVTERERLSFLFESLLARVVRTSKNAEAAQLFIARNPYSEEAYVALIEAELAAGRRAAAVSWVERCRKALAELSEKPSDEFNARFDGLALVEPVIPDALILPFAGRAGELGTLVAKIGAAASGKGSLTLLHGEPGVGKSTLLERAADRASRDGLRVLRVRCTSVAPNPFGPWSEVFSRVGARDFDNFVRSHGADVASAVAQEIVSFLSTPTVVIADDVHELSGNGLQIFIALARAAAAKHAVVAALRPEGVAQLRVGIESLESEEILLGRLDRPNMRLALAEALGNDQPEVLDVLYDRSGGHPLFFVSLLNALVSSGTIKRDGREWRLVKHLDANTELPETVRRYIETRLQVRGDAPHRVAAVLALEPSAGAEDISCVLHLDESATLDALDDLLSLGLITQPLDGPQFAFTHDLIREVAASELNAGRRAALHRALAQRLAASIERDAPLRLARHYQAAGDFLAAAQSYARSADLALEVNAAQDATDWCDAGIAAAERLERSLERDLLLASLHRTGARAALAAGCAQGAIARAQLAATAARATGDVHQIGLSMLDLSATENAGYQSSEQKSDATEAVRCARMCGDNELEALALVQLANASRRLGQHDDALQAVHMALDAAQHVHKPDIAIEAFDELLRAHVTWWRFGEAIDIATEGLGIARLCSPLAEATFRQALCTLWYLLERLDEATAEQQMGLRVAGEAATRRQGVLASPAYSPQVVYFLNHYTAAKIANEGGDLDGAMESLQRATALTNVARLPRYAQALSLLRVDTFLLRNTSRDPDLAIDLVATLGSSSYPQSTIGWSDCVELARARVAARAGTPDVQDLMRRALNVVEENAHATPLEADRAFDRLAVAAEEAGISAIADRARQRSSYYRRMRRAAASHARGESQRTLLRHSSGSVPER